ncbi:MAG: hypothetical protein AAGI46_07790 [Planctomycetota bacterium]
MTRVLSFVTAALAATGVAHADLAQDVADAHGRNALPSGLVLQSPITVNIGGNTMLEGADMTFHSNGALVRIEAGGDTAVFDGQTAWVTPDATMPIPRFQLLTWPYFAVMAYKLDDGGAVLEPMASAPLREGEDPMTRAKLTFTDGTGDSPEDWYILYLNDDNQLIASAYIVTYGKTAAEANPPKAIVYEDYTNVPGPDGETAAVLSPTWSFFAWDENKGLVGEAVGKVTLDDLRFVAPSEDVFEKPEGAAEVEAPAL